MRLIIFLSLFAVAIIGFGCGSDHDIDGEDHGNIVAGALGAILTQTDHPSGWGEANCFLCHNKDNIHQTDRSGTGLNLEAIRSLTETDGLESCSGCHGTNGL